MKVILLGSGNVATHLGKALLSAGHEILQVWSRTQRNAEELAVTLNTQAISRLSELDEGADIYILSVKDDAIPSVVADFPFTGRLLVHTSGTTYMEVLQEGTRSTGVFYPIQTFSKARPVDFKIIPIAVEGNSEEITKLLFELAESISQKVVIFDSKKRRTLHVAAVFACNFSNHLYSIARQVLAQNSLEFELLRPLIAETAAKVQDFYPDEVQTGPAVRNDELTVNKHLAFLEEQPQLRELYEKLSQNIINFYQKA